MKEHLKIRENIITKISKTVGNIEKEDGGICGIDNNGVISSFKYDNGIDSCPGRYIPSIDILNTTLVDWQKNGLRLGAFVHSHPSGNCNISKNDFDYSIKIINNFDYLDSLYLIIVCGTNPKHIRCFRVSTHFYEAREVFLKLIK